MDVVVEVEGTAAEADDEVVVLVHDGESSMSEEVALEEECFHRLWEEEDHIVELQMWNVSVEWYRLVVVRQAVLVLGRGMCWCCRNGRLRVVYMGQSIPCRG